MQTMIHTLWRRRPGFTLIELLVVIALMAILAAVIFPAIQASRQQDTLVKAEQRIKQISAATFVYYDAHGAWPENFVQLEQLEPGFKAKLVDDEPVEGSRFRIRSYENAVEVYSEPANPMRITQRLAVTLDANAAAAFKDGGKFPEVTFTTDKAATNENAIRTQLIFAAFIDSVMSACDCSASQAQEAIDESLQSVTTRDAAWALIDQNDDGAIATNEIFDQPWDTIPMYREDVTSFVDFAEMALEIEDDENPIVQVVDGGKWHHVLVGMLRSQLGLVATTRETHNELISLHETLDHTSDSLRQAELSEAIGNVARFQQKMETFVAAEVVTKDQGDLIVDTAGLLYADLVQKFEKVPQSEWSPPGSAPLHVDWTAPPDPDATGSEDDPFHDVVAALAYAQEREFQAVEIVVHPGIYTGELTITRHTRIAGADGRDTALLAGRLVNEGPFELELADLWLTSDDEIPGVLRVNHADASTFLENVRIDKALGFAIHQSGGEFRCHRLRVDRTEPYSIDVGVAVQFDHRAKVELNDVAMLSNQTAALLISGFKTEVRALRLDIRGTRANRYAVDRIQERINGNSSYDPDVIQPNTQAVDVRASASLEGEFVNIIDNEYVGLLVHSSAAVALSDVEISNTRTPSQIRDHDFSWNVAVLGAGTRLYMSNFNVHDANIGFYVTGDEAQAHLYGTTEDYSSISQCNQAIFVVGYEVLSPLVYLRRIIISYCFVGIGNDGAQEPTVEDVLLIQTEANNRANLGAPSGGPQSGTELGVE